jgi:molecular chaperone IbpA
MIGIGRMADLFDATLERSGDSSYPPYDVEKTGDDSYRITLAAAGFSPADLEILAQSNLLVVTGKKPRGEEAERNYLHRGVAMRGFERRFELADHVVVRDATHADGLLSIELERQVPEALKPRQIQIGVGGQQRLQAPAPTRKAAA